MFVGRLVDLRRPDAVIIDFTRLPKIYPAEPWHLAPKSPSTPAMLAESVAQALHLHKGPTLEERYKEEMSRFYARFLNRELEMNDHRAIIVGVCEATRTFQSNAVVYTTYSRAKLFVPQERKPLTYILAKADPNAVKVKQKVTGWNRMQAQMTGRALPDPVADEVARSIEKQTGLRARTSDEFSWDTIGYFMKYTGIPINFGITTLLGFLVGTAIAGQTFYNFTIENLKQFGALKAMGANNLRIVGMILLQAAVTGLLGYGIGVGAAAWFGLSSKGSELAFFTPWQLLPLTGIAIILICVLASILSVRKVVVLEPAIVFRG
jgi:putative ABC transport system permease protein